MEIKKFTNLLKNKMLKRRINNSSNSYHDLIRQIGSNIVKIMIELKTISIRFYFDGSIDSSNGIAKLYWKDTTPLIDAYCKEIDTYKFYKDIVNQFGYLIHWEPIIDNDELIGMCSRAFNLSTFTKYWMTYHATGNYTGIPHQITIRICKNDIEILETDCPRNSVEQAYSQLIAISENHTNNQLSEGDEDLILSDILIDNCYPILNLFDEPLIRVLSYHLKEKSHRQFPDLLLKETPKELTLYDFYYTMESRLFHRTENIEITMNAFLYELYMELYEIISRCGKEIIDLFPFFHISMISPGITITRSLPELSNCI